jgi:uncharacterized protein
VAIRQIIIDVLTPHEPSILIYAEKLNELESIEAVRILVVEQDDKTKTIEVVVEGDRLSFEKIRDVIDDLGGSVHSVDQVAAGSRIIAYASRTREGGW